ncbi:MAG: hypothetical protein Kow00129_10800 [Thermoleophilia bacterium]
MVENRPDSSGSPPTPGARPLFDKARRILEEHKLAITKSWLSRIINEIDDLSTLEAFPTQESITASVELIEGIANALRDEAFLEDFQPGGRFFERAALLGLTSGSGKKGLENLSRHMYALEDAVWGLLREALRREDQELLDLVVRLRGCLQGVSGSAFHTYYDKSVSELDRLAHTDALTGLHNRRYLIQELERQVEMFKRYHHPFSLLMLDLDNLKWVNDNYGHAAGDAALKHLATIIRMNVRDVDLTFRFGGDEFMVLMPETESTVVRPVAERIHDSLSRTKLKVDDSLITLNVSIGYSSCPDDGREAEELIQAADASLYRSKDQKTGTG